MKYLTSLFFLCLAWQYSSAQISTRKNALSYKFVLTDYNSLSSSYTGGFFSSLGYAGEIGYFRYLNSSVNLGAPLRIGTINDHSLSANEFFVGLDLMGIYKFNNNYILDENARVAPYITAGLGGVYMTQQDGNFDFQIPVGLGANIRLVDGLYAQLQAEYRQSILVQKSNLALSVGVLWAIGKKEAPEPEPKEPEPKDTDGDGITDKEDACPLVAGLAKFKGCPDSDEDGIMDKEDDCPKVAGIAKFNGCPDTDSDGLKDSEDDCPTEAGPISNNGCPEPDTIKPDDLEILKQAMKDVQFESKKATLLESSHDILDKIADLLKRYPKYNLKIHGHTDNVGSSTNNIKLSKDRAKACLDYLVNKGINADRLSSKGFGETQPIESNDTVEGRANNRRVEFIPYKR